MSLQENILNQLTKDQDLKNLGKQIADSIPALADLSEKQLKEVASWYLKKKLTDDMESLVNSSSIDLDLSKTHFLALFDSLHTKKSYINSLTRFEDFCKKKNKDYLSMTPALADEWILTERQGNRASASIRKDVASVSSFYTFLERQHNIKNIFRGTKARPKNKSKKELIIPDKKDFETIVNNVPGELSIIVQLMAKLGLRAGAFESLSLYGKTITTITKNKEFKWSVSDEIIKIFDENNLSRKEPFSKWKAYKIENLLRYYTEKLYKQGQIKAVYSAHDFRHFFAVTEYTKNKDIFRLSKLLNHSSIQTTQLYLRSLNFDV